MKGMSPSVSSGEFPVGKARTKARDYRKTQRERTVNESQPPKAVALYSAASAPNTSLALRGITLDSSRASVPVDSTRDPHRRKPVGFRRHSGTALVLPTAPASKLTQTQVRLELPTLSPAIMVAASSRGESTSPAANRSTLAGLSVVSVARPTTAFKDRRKTCPSSLELSLTLERIERMHVSSTPKPKRGVFRPLSGKADIGLPSGRSSPPVLVSRTSPSMLLARRIRTSASPTLFIVAASDTAIPASPAQLVPLAPRSGSSTPFSTTDRFFQG